MGQWCELPCEILFPIIGKLASLLCLIRFTAVCKSWKSAAMNKKNSNQDDILPQPPWLLITNKAIIWKIHKQHYYHVQYPYNSPFFCWFYGLSDKRNRNVFRKVKIPGPPKTFIGSSGTWLITVDTENTIHLFNPLSLHELHLPSKTRPGHFELSDITISKVVLSCSKSLNSSRRPTMNKISRDNHHGVVAAALLHYYRLCFVRPGDDAWTVIDQCCPHRFHDIIFYQEKLHAVNCSGSVFVCDLLSDRFPPKAEELLIESSSVDQPHGNRHRGTDIEYYLVDVLGDLMLVLRFVFHCSLRRVTKSFKIFKLDFTLMKWEIVKSLGYHSLFLGENASASIIVGSESSSTLIRKNCIYFTDKRSDPSFGRSSYNVGMFVVENKSVQHLYLGNSYVQPQSLPIWMIPIAEDDNLHGHDMIR